MARAVWADTVVAESDDVVVVDGFTYFPKREVNWQLLEPGNHRSVCPWKGQARYYSIKVNGSTNTDAAWEYPEPKPAASMVRDRIGFWRGVRIEP